MIKNMKEIGKIPLKKASDIKHSPFCVGCETLDRDLWNPKEIFPLLGELPVKHARLQTGWSRCEKQKGVYDFKWLERCVDGLNELGITPFLNVGYGNSLYAPMKADGIGTHPLENSEYLDAWKNFVAELTRLFARRVSAFEIWNEPNMPGIFWQPADKREPEVYARLFQETADTIRTYDDCAMIAGGVISCMDYEFTRRFLQALDSSDLDIFSFHPYRTFPERHYHKQVKALRQLVDKHSPETRLWQAEYGIPSSMGSTGYKGEIEYTELIQAKVLLRKLLDDCGLGIELSEWFLAVDLHDYPKGTGRTNSKGLIRVKPEITPKPSFKALQNLGSIINGEINTAIHTAFAVDKKLNIDQDFITKLFMAEYPDRNEVQVVYLDVDNSPVLGYWRNDVILDQREFDTTHIILQDCEGRLFDTPVLCDPLAGDIYEISDTKYEQLTCDAWTTQVFSNLPLTDSPLLIIESPIKSPPKTA